MPDTSHEDRLLLMYKLLPLSVKLKKTLSLFFFLNKHWYAIYSHCIETSIIAM